MESPPFFVCTPVLVLQRVSCIPLYWVSTVFRVYTLDGIAAIFRYIPLYWVAAVFRICILYWVAAVFRLRTLYWVAAVFVWLFWSTSTGYEENSCAGQRQGYISSV